VYLSAGGLVLTIGFVKEVVLLETASYLPLLFATWIALILVLTINLLSHKSTSRALDFYLEYDFTRGKRWDGVTRYLNLSSTFLFLVGVVSFIFFVILNIHHG